MFIRVAAPGMELSQEQVDGIEEDLAKARDHLRVKQCCLSNLDGIS